MESRASCTRSIPILGAGTVFIGPDEQRSVILARIAARQRQRLARWQLLMAGAPPGVHRAVAAQQPPDRRPARGYTRCPCTQKLPLAPEAEALLACGHGAGLSHHSAAVLWRMRPGQAKPVQVTVPHDRRSARKTDSFVVHRSRILTPEDFRILER